MSCVAELPCLSKAVLESGSPIVSTVARYGINYDRMNSRLGRNAFFLQFPL